MRPSLLCRGITRESHEWKELSVALCLAALVGTFVKTGTGPEQLVPRNALFGHSGRSLTKISPDGKQLAYVAQPPGGVDNVWVESLDHTGARMLTNAKRRGIEAYWWAHGGTHILFKSDENGTEDSHLYSVGVTSGEVRDLTPIRGAGCAQVLLSSRRPHEALATLNARDSHVFDAYRIDLPTGAIVLDTANPGDVMSWTADVNLVVRAATAFRVADAATVVRIRDSAAGPWRDLMVMPFEDSPILGQLNGGSIIIGFSEDGSGLYVGSLIGSNTTRLVELETATGRERRTIAADPEDDIWRNPFERFIVLQEPRTQAIQAVPFDGVKRRWSAVDPNVRRDVEFLQTSRPGVVSIDSQDLANRKWTVTFQADTAPPESFLYDRDRVHLQLISDAGARLKNVVFASMRAVEIKARDGFRLLSYLTLPVRGPGTKLPLILLVHGGPWYRDEWGYEPSVQLLANRGYAVLQVQYRGSEGLGKAYLQAGNRQMGTGTDDDLADAVHWAVGEGIADPKRVAVMGYSFGGYHTLRALTRHPELYACGIDIVGVSDLRTSLQVIPDYWVPVLKRHILRLGDVLSDSKLDEELSPLFHVSELRAPLLIAHGLNDVRVSVNESQQIVSVMRKRGLRVTFVVYPDEGHFISRPENVQDLYGRIEAFLHEHLGGANEPYESVPGSSGELR